MKYKYIPCFLDNKQKFNTRTCHGWVIKSKKMLQHTLYRAVSMNRQTSRERKPPPDIKEERG